MHQNALYQVGFVNIEEIGKQSPDDVQSSLRLYKRDDDEDPFQDFDDEIVKLINDASRFNACNNYADEKIRENELNKMYFITQAVARMALYSSYANTPVDYQRVNSTLMKQLNLIQNKMQTLILAGRNLEHSLSPEKLDQMQSELKSPVLNAIDAMMKKYDDDRSSNALQELKNRIEKAPLCATLPVIVYQWLSEQPDLNKTLKDDAIKLAEHHEINIVCTEITYTRLICKINDILNLDFEHVNLENKESFLSLLAKIKSILPQAVGEHISQRDAMKSLLHELKQLKFADEKMSLWTEKKRTGNDAEKFLYTSFKKIKMDDPHSLEKVYKLLNEFENNVKSSIQSQLTQENQPENKRLEL
jgi:hypothetical protein